jgi:hypothetical protein
LAGHSQGSNVLIHLLSGYLKNNPSVYQRMIAAYVIGYPVTSSYLANNPHLKFASGPDDLGVIISYNTQAPSVVPPNNPVVSNIVGLVINPITWTRTESEATTAKGLGSLMPDSVTSKFQPVQQYADANDIFHLIKKSNFAFALAVVGTCHYRKSQSSLHVEIAKISGNLRQHSK